MKGNARSKGKGGYERIRGQAGDYEPGEGESMRSPGNRGRERERETGNRDTAGKFSNEAMITDNVTKKASKTEQHIKKFDEERVRVKEKAAVT